MFKILANSTKRIITDFFQRTYKAIQKKDLYEFIDLALIWSVIFVIAFCIVYKIATNVEVMIWQTRTLVIQDNIKNSLPQIYFFFLMALGYIKWVINIRRSNLQNSLQRNESLNYFQIKIFTKTFQLSKSTMYSLGFILIILLFFLIKIPYWGLSFTVNHPLKYSTYAEPALKMFELHDPFVMQTQYMHNPLTDSRGIGTTFGNLPILEWILYIGYSIFHTIFSLETITRMAMSFIGASALLAIFTFLRREFNDKVAILTSAFLAINQIFNLSSFVTVYDTINIALTFFAYTIILKFNDSGKFRDLIVASLILGIGAAIKENILLWAFPTLAIFLVKRNGSIGSYLSALMTTFIFSLLPLFLTRMSINYFPTKETKYFIFFFIGIALIALITKLFIKYQKKIVEIFNKIWAFTLLHKVLFLLPIVLLVLGIYLLYMSSISEEFLTDWKLLFNIDLYIEFINVQAIPYVGIFITCLAISALFLIPLYEKSDRRNKTLLALTFGSVFYIVMASKVLFFHSYYWLYIIITIVLIAMKGLIILSKQFNNSLFSTIFLIMTFISSALFMVGSTRVKLNREIKSVHSVVKYINDLDLDDGTSFIDQGSLTYLTFKTNIYRVYDNSVFENDLFINSTRKNGLSITMDYYNIKYLITANGAEPDYLIFANLFSKNRLATSSYRRTDIIYSQLYPTKYKYYPDQEIREELLDLNQIEKQFYIIKDFGEYTVYGLTPACFDIYVE